MRRGAPPPSCRLHTTDRIVTVSGKRPASVPVVSEAGHGTSAHWHAGCHCTQCRSAHSNSQRAWGRARAQERLPAEVRQQLLDAIYAGQPFRTVLRDLGLTSNRVFLLTKTEEEWSAARTRPMWRAVSAAGAASISGSGWRGTVADGPDLPRTGNCPGHWPFAQPRSTCPTPSGMPGRARQLTHSIRILITTTRMLFRHRLGLGRRGRNP
jgi:hypothetical protein